MLKKQDRTHGRALLVVLVSVGLVGCAQRALHPTDPATNRAPTATQVRIQGTPAVGATLTLSYAFSDPDDDAEGASLIVWSTPEGELQRGPQKQLTVPAELDGAWIGAEVVPVDAHGLAGSAAAAENNRVRIGGRGLLPETYRFVKRVELPSCSDPNAFHIRTAEDWDHLNDPDKRIFCVAPSDYTALGAIHITASGSADEPRYLLLDNGNDRHPARLERSELARYRLQLEGAHHWVIDRPGYWEDPHAYHSPLVLREASDNLIQRAYYVDTGGTVRLYAGSHRNTLQYFHMEKTNWAVRYAEDHGPNPPNQERIFADHGAIELFVDGPDQSVWDNVIVENELINYVDGVQLVRSGRGYPAEGEPNPRLDAAGTVIAGNLIYTTPTIYTDGAGRFDSQGAFALSENALDFKFGSLDPERPVRVLGNVMFGYRVSDATYSSLSDNGNAMVFHYGIANFEIEGNYVFDCRNALTIGDPRGGEPALHDARFLRNAFFDFGQNIAHLYGSREHGVYDSAADVDFVKNIFGAAQADSLLVYKAERLRIAENTFVHTAPMRFSPGHPSRELRILDNRFFGMSETGIPDYAEASGNVHLDTGFDAEPYSISLLLRRLTAAPERLRLVPE